MTLREVLVEAAAELPDIEAREAGDEIEWAAHGHPFAALRGTTAEFRLTGRIGQAALGTPDTMRAARGADWVAFRPPELDRFAIDRAVAWFESAHRHAARP